MASRATLGSNAALAQQMRLPAGLRVTDSALTRTADFLTGRVQLELPAPAAASQGFPLGPPLHDVYSAFFHPEAEHLVTLPRPVKAATAAPSAAGATRWEMTLSAVPEGPQKGWRHVILTVAPVASNADTAAIGGVNEVLRSWEQSVLEGDLSPLARCLNPDPLCIAVQTPDGQSWFFTYPEYFTTMLGTALSMGNAQKSQMLDLDTRVSGPVATVAALWAVEIPVFGSMQLGMTSVLVNVKGTWLLVGLTAGAAEH